MSRERIAAVRTIAAKTGKPASEVLAALGPTWGLSPFERHALEIEIAGDPTDEQRATAKAADKAATEAAASRTKQADSEALEAFRYQQQLKQSNVFLAAQHRLQFASQIDRGSELNELLTTTEPPPEAA